MDLSLIAGAFGGGVAGAAFGALPSFIMTGVLAICGGIAAMAGANDYSVANITFGVFWGPHIAFAGAAAAASFASARRKKLDSCQNTLKPLYSIDDIPTLLVGGIFGVIGFIFYTLFTTKLSFIGTDAPGAGVFFSLLVCRLVVGKTGPFGDMKVKNEVLNIKDVLKEVTVGLFLGLVIGAAGLQIQKAGIDAEQMASYPVICFGIAAVMLVFLQMGNKVPVTHHIAFPAAYGFVLTSNIFVAAVIGGLNAFLWIMACRIFNSRCDTYIDPPATVIMITVPIINLIFG